MITRSFDAARVNAVANDPAVRPGMGVVSAGDIDLSDAVACRRNLFLFGAHGGWSFIWSAPGVFEIHTTVLPEGRGVWAYAAVREALALAASLGARLVWTRIRPKDRHTRLFARAAGFAPAGRDLFDIGDGPEEFDLMTWRPECHS